MNIYFYERVTDSVSGNRYTIIENGRRKLKGELDYGKSIHSVKKTICS